MSSFQRYGRSFSRHVFMPRMFPHWGSPSSVRESPRLGECVTPSFRTLGSIPVEVTYSSGRAASLVCSKATASPTCLPSLSRSFSSDERRFKIYTRTGDKGSSSLYDGQRRRKDDPTFEALGDVDELNSVLGLAHEYCAQAQILDMVQQIEEIQSRLLDVGSAIATPLSSLSSKKLARVKFNPELVPVLEKWIDEMDEVLPPLTGFILPSGGLPASALHMARSVCRRAERKVVYLVSNELVEQSVVQYLNRLSDYLFTAARYTAMKLGKPETLWQKL